MREELKYVMPLEQLPALRKALAPFVELDPHGRGFEERGYTVRSIYLDSADLCFYHEKQDHLQHRKKLRVRGYNQEREIVTLEIKRKNTSRIAKDRARVRFADLDALFATGRFADYVCSSTTDAVHAGRRFLYHVYKDQLAPTALVVYEREAFRGRFDADFRITLDRNLRGGLYPAFDELFTSSDFIEVMPGSFIMEVKCGTRMPALMRQVIAEFAATQRAASKYCMCIDLFERRLDTKTAVLASRAALTTSHENAMVRSPLVGNYTAG